MISYYIERLFEMSYFKKFTDTIGIVGVFSAGVHLVSKYMSYSETLIEEGSSKLERFFSRISGMENRHYLFFVMMFFASLVLCRLFHKLPAVCAVVSFLPLLRVMDMIWGKNISSQPMLYLAVASLFFFGNVYECVWSDREGLPHGCRTVGRTFIGGGIFGALATASSAAGIYFIQRYVDVYETFCHGELSDEVYRIYDDYRFFGVDLFSMFEDEDVEALTVLTVLLVLSLLLSLVFRGVYFLNAAFAAVPFVYMLYVWNKGVMIPNAMAVVLFSCAYFVLMLVAFISGAKNGAQDFEIIT